MKIIFIIVVCLIGILNTLKAQIAGCTDPLATNYSSVATINDGSCIYNSVSVLPVSSSELSDTLKESSGLIYWNNRVWTNNDNTDINLYSLDTINGNIIQAYPLTGTINNDWEEISQDSTYIYVGDFGNNLNGNRTDLRILRVNKTSLLSNEPVIDTISYSYSDQTNFAGTGANKTDFDCEAFVVSADSIYLFTKQWVSNKTSLYSLPKVPGTYIAHLKTKFDVGGLVTGAVLLESKRIVVLCGYSNLLQPFIYLLYDFQGSDFFGGNKRRIELSLPFYQIEGVASTNGIKYYLTNEHFTQLPLIDIQQKIHILELNSYLGNYLNSSILSQSEVNKPENVTIYPNPGNDIITIKMEDFSTSYFLLNSLGQTVLSGWLIKDNSNINISELSQGMYFLKFGEKSSSALKVIKN